jgi:hypothetical protein
MTTMNTNYKPVVITDEQATYAATNLGLIFFKHSNVRVNPENGEDIISSLAKPHSLSATLMLMAMAPVSLYSPYDIDSIIKESLASVWANMTYRGMETIMAIFFVYLCSLGMDNYLTDTDLYMSATGPGNYAREKLTYRMSYWKDFYIRYEKEITERINRYNINDDLTKMLVGYYSSKVQSEREMANV